MIEITQVHASLDEAGDEAACLAIGRRAVKRALRCEDSQIKAIELHRKSIDARKKRDVHFILSFRVELTSSRLEQEVVDRVAERDRSRIRMVDGEAPSFPNPVPNAPKGRPVVVGAGCAGLFAALTLAEAGLKPPAHRGAATPRFAARKRLISFLRSVSSTPKAISNLAWAAQGPSRTASSTRRPRILPID
ncbi:MAG: hypothetical protein ACLS3Y_12305 [Collinsella sp.]